MGDNWLECKLSDACRSIDYGLTAAATETDTGLRLLRITDIVPGFIDWNTVPFATEKLAPSSRFRLVDGDIVIARTGASTGVSCYVKEPPEAAFASYLVRLQAEPQFDPLFLAYYLKSEPFWTYLRGVLGDKSAQPNASASTMVQAPLRAPRRLQEQSAIAFILGSFDDKIKLNRRMSQTLESMARALFRSWFVDFDPVRAKAEGRDPGLPQPLADLFPDRFEDSQLGEIPAGWGAGTIRDLMVLQRGFDLPSSLRQEGSFPVLAASGPSGTHAEFKIRGPGVTTGRSGVLGKVFYVERDFWPLNTSLWIKEFGGCGPSFAFYLLQTLPLEALNAGSAVPTLNRNHVHDLATLIPPFDLLSFFEVGATKLLTLQGHLDRCSETLANLRDTLLPKLISGELRIQDPAKFLESVL